MTDIAMEAGTFRLADVFSKTFAIYGRRFVPFIVLTIIASMPNYVAILAIGIPTSPENAASFGWARAALTLLEFATKSFVGGAVIYGVVQDLRGRTFSVGDSLRIALNRFLPLLGVTICAVLAIFLGTILLIVPGLILACMFFVATPACVAEQTSVFESLSRSRFLTKGYRWQVFGMFLLLIVMGMVIGAIAGLVAATAGYIGVVIFTQALGVFLSSFNGVLVSVFYYELRVAKEGVDIEKIASVFD
jgi:hypothetical protein